MKNRISASLLLHPLLMMSAMLSAVPLASATEQSSIPAELGASALLADPSPVVLESVSTDSYLALPDELVNILDTHVATLPLSRSRAAAIHNVLFGEQYFAIQYDNEQTKTAAETFLTRSGNCLSLAALYVAAARRVGLNAVFQRVDVPLQWESADDFNLVYGHTNVLVKLRSRNITVELVDLYPAEESKNFPSTPLSDTQALASYYNNRGAELLKQGHREIADQAFNKALDLYATYSDAWVNRGVLAKLTGDFVSAEQAYLNGYKYNKRNLSALNNLFALYRQIGEQKKADQIAARLHKHQMKNPFYLASAAHQRIQQKQDVGTAIKWLEKAIKIKPNEAEFHKLLAQALYLDQRIVASKDAMQRAISLSDSPEKIDLLKEKLAAINRTL